MSVSSSFSRRGLSCAAVCVAASNGKELTQQEKTLEFKILQLGGFESWSSALICGWCPTFFFLQQTKKKKEQKDKKGGGDFLPNF